MFLGSSCLRLGLQTSCGKVLALCHVGMYGRKVRPELTALAVGAFKTICNLSGWIFASGLFGYRMGNDKSSTGCEGRSPEWT